LVDKARFSNATVILVVDRNELEGQLKGWVERLLGEMHASDIAVRRADSKAGLQDIFDSDFRGLVVSMIHKFEEIKADSSLRDNICVHRRGAPLSRCRPGHLPYGCHPERYDYRLHGHTGRRQPGGLGLV
jgi:type I site-specific restriction-modification system R (restriction) subunit